MSESDDHPAGHPSSSAKMEAAPLAHVRDAWRSWLSALATDAEAAVAAALAYESLPAEARDAWLDTLVTDGATVDVPALALYAPLLAVESDGMRRSRIEAAIAAAPSGGAGLARRAHAFRGVAADGTHACVVVAPIYLDFVQVIACRYTPGGGFVTVEHEPLRHRADLPQVVEVHGVGVEPTPLRIVIEDLAHAILADKREGRERPASLASFAHLFVPDLDDEGVESERNSGAGNPH